MKQIIKKWTAALLTFCMLLALIPGQAFAALIDNSRDKNQQILRELEDFWGDEKTAEEAMGLLKQYGLIDEKGNIVENWNGSITLADSARPVSFSQVYGLEGDTVTVNQRACARGELQEILGLLAGFGLLKGDTLNGNWQLRRNGEPLVPGALMSELRHREEGGAEAMKACEITVLGQKVSEAEMLQLLNFLDRYALLGDLGAKPNWGLTVPGKSRPTNLSELVAMLEDPGADRDQIITVDGTPITLADFEIMMAIEKEANRIRDTYFADPTETMTTEHAESLASLYSQLERGDGITLYNTVRAQNLVFPSGADHSQRISVPAKLTMNKLGTIQMTVTLDHPAKQPVSVDWWIDAGSTGLHSGGSFQGTLNFGIGEQTKVFDISNNTSEVWMGARIVVVQFANPVGAVFQGETLGASTVVEVKDTHGIVYQQPPMEAKGTKTINGSSSQMGDGMMGTGDVPISASARMTATVTEQIKDGIRRGLLNCISGVPIRFGDWDPNYKVKVTGDCYIGTNNSGKKIGHVSYNEVHSDEVYNGTARFIIDDSNRNDILNASSVYVEMTFDYGLGGLFNFDGVRFTDVKGPEVQKAEAPKHEYVYGQTIPVTLTFNEETKAELIKADINGVSISTGGGNDLGTKHTLLYPVKKVDTPTLQIRNIEGMVDTYGQKLNDSICYPNKSPMDTRTWNLSGTTIRIPDDMSAINMPTSDKVTVDPVYNAEQKITAATVGVSVALPSEAVYRDYILGQNYLDSNGKLHNGKYAASIDGGTTLVPFSYDNDQNPTRMTAQFTIDITTLNNITQGQDFVAEMYRISVQDKTPVNQGLLFNRYAAFSINKPVPLMGSMMSVDQTANWPAEAIYLNKLPSLRLRAQLTGAENCTWKQYIWKSTNEQVASIDQQGNVSFLKPGTVQFYLVAENGGIQAYQGQESAKTPEITILEGATPYLSIAQEAVTIRSGEPVTVRWASNIAQKNEEHAPAGEKTTTFTIRVENIQTKKVEEIPVTFDPAKKVDAAAWPDQSHTFNNLNAVSQNGEASYWITVSGNVHSSVPGHEPQGFTSKPMKVYVISKPVTVKLNRPQSLMITDQQAEFDVSYRMENFDLANMAQFRAVVTDNSTGAVVYENTAADAAVGSFSFPVKVSNGYRNIFDVTVEAKNTAEQTWSRDSYTLYVYDDQCLRIVAEAVENGRVTTQGDQITLSNRAWIKSLTQDEILALKRDINLKTMLSINCDDHEWSEVMDRIQWSTTPGNHTASLNYALGDRYADIETLAYTSYGPLTRFLLSGDNDGSTVIQAVHAMAGDQLSAQATVTVETLKDRLYLFQCYPAQKTHFEYTDKAGELKTGETNEQGQGAVYEEQGIDQPVYFSVNNAQGSPEYFGTLYPSALMTQERSAATMDLYPINVINMREAAKVPIYLKTSEGKDYTGPVQVRVGVYRNGEYCADAKVDNQTAGKTQDYVVPFKDGSHTFTFDVMQFLTAQNQEPVMAADEIRFVFELRVDGHYPILTEILGSLNQDASIRTGDRVLSLETVSQGEENKPFVARQNVYFAENEMGPEIDVRNSYMRVGPSRNNPEIYLKTAVFWWGQPAGGALSMTTPSGSALINQSSVDSGYSFTSFPVTVNTVKVDDRQFSAHGVGVLRGMQPKLEYLTTENGKQVKSKTEELCMTLFNGIRIKSVLDDATGILGVLRSRTDQKSAGLGKWDDMAGMGLALATLLQIDLGPVTLKLEPTSDPLLYRGYVLAGINGIEGDNVSGAGADLSERDSDLDMGPGWEQIKGVFKHGLKGYANIAENQVKAAQNILKHNKKQGRGISRTSDGDTVLAFHGGFETVVYYNFDQECWEMKLVTGEFTGGGGYGRHWLWNAQVGSVPLFLDLGLGANALVDFHAAINTVEDYNEYLTDLKINAYIRAFGGVGFDYTVIAIKFGLFGQMDFNATLRWLNKYGEDKAIFTYDTELGGSVGIKMQLRLLFISYEKILWSESIKIKPGTDSKWTTVERYWNSVALGTYDYNSPFYHAQTMMLDHETGNAMYQADVDAALVPRDYLRDGGRRWNSGISLFALGTGPSAVLNPAYPEANPVLSTDGSYMFYLDDLDDPTDATALRVAVSARSGSTYQQGQVIDNQGYGDSYVKAAGTGDQSVVVWSRLMEKPAITEAGEQITPNIQAMMLNSSEVMVATRSGSGWTTHRLTDNQNIADIAPAVATNGSRTVVVWRQTDSLPVGTTVESENPDSLPGGTTGESKVPDSIWYAVYENGSWSENMPLYSGDQGAVSGLEVEMTADGQAMVTFITNTTGNPDGSGQEIFYAILSAADNQVSRFARLTNDSYLDENPQLTAVEIGGEEHFVLGWHSMNGAFGTQESDIRLAAVDSRGNRMPSFVDSLSLLTQNSYTNISGNFRFVKNADRLDQLSILWSEAVMDPVGDKEAGKDKITGVRFTQNGPEIGLTAAQELAVMDDYTTVNLFDGFVSGEQVELVVLGTFYDGSRLQTNLVTDGVRVQEVYTATPVTGIYTASGRYTDEMRLEYIAPDYKSIRLSMEVPVQLGVTNVGTRPIEGVTVKIGSDTRSFGPDNAFVSIKPGETRELRAFHTMGSRVIEDPDYEITVTFAGGQTARTSGTLTMNIPDTGITSNQAMVKAEDGFRTLQFTLFNLGDSYLSGSNSQVCFNLFTDSACTEPVDPSYLERVQTVGLFANQSDALYRIGSESDLKKIDEGRYTLQYRFNVKDYIARTNAENKTPFADPEGEIRDGGITLYAKVWAEKPDDRGNMVPVTEFMPENNVTQITVESLKKQSNGEPVTVSSSVVPSGGGTDVMVSLQNNSIVQDESGNISVTLLNAQEEIVGWQQSYNLDNSQLLSLNPEQAYQRTFRFDGVENVAKAVVTYDQKVTLNDDATLNQFAADKVPITLDQFQAAGPGRFTATVTAEDMARTVVTATPNSVYSQVSIQANTPAVTSLAPEAESLGGSKVVEMSPGGNTVITVTVTAQNQTQQVYELTIVNKDSRPHTQEIPEATAVYQSQDVVLSVDASKQSDLAQLSYQWYQFGGTGVPADQSTDGWSILDGAEQASYSFSKANRAGDYYFYCRVTSTNTQDQTFTTDSNVVKVTITQSETEFDGGIRTYLSGVPQTSFTYGDTISVKVTPHATGRPVPGVQTMAAPTGGALVLYKNGDTSRELGRVENVVHDQEVTFTLNTWEIPFLIGANTLQAKYLGDGSMQGFEAQASLTVSARAMADARVGNVENQPLDYTGSQLTPVVTVEDNLAGAYADLVRDRDYTLSYRDNIQTGTDTAVLTVTGMGNYTGSVERSFSIQKVDSQISAPTISSDAITYGDRFTISFKPVLLQQQNNLVSMFAIGPESKTVELYYGGNLLDTKTGVTENDLVTFELDTVALKGNDKIPAAAYDGGSHSFTIKWGGDDNLNPSTGTVTATLHRRDAVFEAPVAVTKLYDNSTAAETEVIDQPLTNLVVGDDVALDSYSYQAAFADKNAADTIPVTVTNVAITLKGAHKDYYTPVVQDSYTVDGTIRPLPLEESFAPAGLDSHRYTGQALTPDVPMTDTVNGNLTLTLDQDYELTYTDNVLHGTAGITITGIGNYTGSLARTFSIEKEGSAVDQLTISSDAITYGDRFTISFKPVLLQQQNNLVSMFAAGPESKTVELYYGGNLLDTKTGVTENDLVTFELDTVALKGNDKIPAAAYDGGSHSFTIKWGGDDNLNPSTGTVTATLHRRGAVLEAPVAVTKLYDNSTAAETVVIDRPLTNLVAGDDVALDSYSYQAAFADKNAADTIPVTVTNVAITLKGAHKDYYAPVVQDSYTVDGTIRPLPLEESFAPADLASCLYTGSPRTPGVAVTDTVNGDLALIQDRDYELSYTDNVRHGTAGITITGVGNYTGSLSRSFRIEKADSEIGDPLMADAITYGEPMTISFTPRLLKEKNALLNLFSSSPAGKTAELYYGGNLLDTRADVTENDLVTFQLDTAALKGEDKIPAAAYDGKSHSFTIKWGGDDNLNPSTGTVEAILNPRVLTLKAPSVVDKPFDNGVIGLLSLPEQPFENLVSGDRVQVDQFRYQAKFASPDIKAQIPVEAHVTDCTFKGEDSSYYRLTWADVYRLTGNIISIPAGTATVENRGVSVVLSQTLPDYGEEMGKLYGTGDKLKETMAGALGTYEESVVYDVKFQEPKPTKDAPLYLYLPLPAIGRPVDTYIVCYIGTSDGVLAEAEATVVPGVGLRVCMPDEGPLCLSMNRVRQTENPSPSPSYRVDTPEPENGTISLSRKYPKQGDEVDMTLTPREGYEVESIRVVQKDGTVCQVEKIGENTYRFTQPDQAVEISVVFVEQEKAVEPEEKLQVQDYSDLNTEEWYADGIQYCLDKGIMNGYGDRTFHPHESTSRAMVAVMLWRIAGSPVVNFAMDFTDVKEGDWYAEAIRWALSEGILNGYGNGLMGPNDTVTREQLAAMLYRSAAAAAGDTAEADDLDALFADSGEISSYAHDALAWCVSRQIINGKGAGMLEPASLASRAETATMMMRYLER